MADFADDREMLVAYRTKKRDIDEKIAELLRQKSAIESIIRGLQLLLGEGGQVRFTEIVSPPPGPDPLLSGATVAEELFSRRPPYEATVLERGLLALVSTKRPMTAAEIKHWIDKNGGGRPANYQTLYKALRREAAKGAPRIMRMDDAFTLTKRGSVFLSTKGDTED